MARSGSSWAKGQSGNPAGRKADSAVSKARLKLARSLPAIIDVVVKSALAGDLSACKLILERLIPIAKQDYADLEQRIAAMVTTTTRPPDDHADQIAE